MTTDDELERFVAEAIAFFEEPRGDVEDRVEGICEVLRALAPRRRLEMADRLKLPISARPLGDRAAPLLRLLLEDNHLRPFFGDVAARLWLDLDVHGALPAALGAADEINSMTLLSLARRLEPDEAFDILEPRFARDPFFRELLASSNVASGEDRWVDKALGRLHDEPRAAVHLLLSIRTRRAEEELLDIADHADETSPAFQALVAVVNDSRRSVSTELSERVVRRVQAGQELPARSPWNTSPDDDLGPVDGD